MSTPATPSEILLASDRLAAVPPTSEPVDSILLVSFGGPEGPADVVPFLENVTRGRGIPRERLVEVGAHYDLFGGRSPINDQARGFVAAIAEHTGLPVYWGNRNWDPYLTDALTQMARDGRRHALSWTTSVFSSYSGCRQYREDVGRARAAIGDAPVITRLRHAFDHPLYVAALVDAVRLVWTPGARLVFTAHSIPMAQASTCDYEAQLRATAALVSARVGAPFDLVWQSRSGPPQVPWLEPDIGDHLATLSGAVVVVPVGFVSDHIEVLYDLDTVAAEVAAARGLPFARAATPGTDPDFIGRLVAALVDERLHALPRPGLTAWGPMPDVCRPGCCPPPLPRAAGRPAAAPTGHAADQ